MNLKYAFFSFITLLKNISNCFFIEIYDLMYLFFGHLLSPLFSRSEELISIKMYHMIGHISYPDFCLPRKAFRKLLECLEIEKRCHIYLSCRYISSHFFDFLYTFRIHRTDRGDRFHEIYPILISSVQYHIRHFIMQGNLKSKLTQLVNVLYKVFSIVSPT